MQPPRDIPGITSGKCPECGCAVIYRAMSSHVMERKTGHAHYSIKKTCCLDCWMRILETEVDNTRARDYILNRIPKE